MARQAKGASTRDVVADLLNRPPLNDGELGRRLRGVNRVDARREIVDRLFFGSPSRDEFEMLSAALLKIGVEGQEARLERIVADVRRARAQRWTALSLIFTVSMELANRILLDLAPDESLRLMLQPAAEAVSEVMEDPAAAGSIADALAAMHPEMRAEAIAYLEEVRRSAGTPAVLAYREVLRRAGLDDIRNLALEAIVAEGGAEAASELVDLRNAAKDAGARQAIQRALLRVGTRAIEAAPASPAVPGKAYMGICDGQGAFIVLGCFENSDGTTTIADLCVRADADVRDGFVAPALDEASVAELFAKMGESGLGDLAPLSLAEAAAIVFAGVERTRRADLPLPEDTRPALLLFERARGSATKPPRAPAPPAERGPVTLAEARALLALPFYESWFFDAGDFRGAGVSLPTGRRRKPREDWIEGALARLEASEVAPRLAAMLDHMARWHALRGELDRAATGAASAAEVRRSFPTCAVPRVMLERSVEVLRAQEGGRTGVVGDPAVRDRIRLELFQDVSDPKGRDLAVLDFTEAALAALDSAFEALPGSRRPRESDLLRAAHALATTFVRWVLSRRRARPEALLGDLTKSLGELTGLDAEERAGVVSVVLPALVTFVGEVCERCPVACLTRPKATLTDTFFAPEHPAFG
jgi:hypothetical protein